MAGALIRILIMVALSQLARVVDNVRPTDEVEAPGVIGATLVGGIESGGGRR